MRRLFLIPPLAALLIFGAACSGDDDSTAATPTPTESPALADEPTAEGSAVPDGLQYVFDAVGGDINVDDMRPFLSDDLNAMSDADIADAIFCFPSDVSAEVLDEAITRSGDSAQLIVSWHVTDDDASTIDTDVDRTWQFQKVDASEDSGYKITGLPQECPFEPADTNGTQEPTIETPTP